MSVLYMCPNLEMVNVESLSPPQREGDDRCERLIEEKVDRSESAKDRSAVKTS